MSTPTLDELGKVRAPAWLWDAERMRIVWANSAGTAFFGQQSLFDLIDTPFDETDPGVGRVGELSAEVKRGESWQELIGFASAMDDTPISVTVYVHSLADGRKGLLMVGHTAPAEASSAPASDSAAADPVLDGLPAAIVVCDGDGNIRYANEAARKLTGLQSLTSMQALGAHEAVQSLFERAMRAGLATATVAMETGFGARDIRTTVKAMVDGNAFSLVLEDITDRRRLEQGESVDAPEASSPTPLKVVETPKADKSAREEPVSLASIRQAIEAAAEDEPASPKEVAEIKATEPASPTPPEKPKPASKRFDVAEIVHRALSRIPRAIVLYRSGKLVYANLAVATALGYDSEGELVGQHDIATALGTLAGKSGRIMLPSATGEDVEFKVDKSTFPWNDGAIPMASLTVCDVADAEPVAEQVETVVETVSDEPGDAVEEATVEIDDEQIVEEKPAEVPTRPTPSEDTGPNAAALLSVLDTASDGIVFLTKDGSITQMSAGAEALFGVHEANVLDTKLADLMDKTSAKTVRDYVAALGDSGVTAVFNGGREVVAKMHDGGEVQLFMTMQVLPQDITGIPQSAYCAVMRDITQWKKTERELRDARDRAETTSRQKSDFLARISHELRTPLNAILGFSDVMRKGQFGKLGSERYEGYANDIHTSGEYLLSLVNDLLDLSKVEAGKLELNFVSVDLGHAIDACIKLMQDEATGARVVLRKSIAPDLPQVVADMRSIKQVLLNLIGNSIKFTDPGGQVITSVKMLDSGELLLSVSDTGIGMNDDQLSKALEPFRRVEVAGRPDVQGTGLGLPLTKALVEANRAEFAISSESRKGTRVDITFPTTRVLAG